MSVQRSPSVAHPVLFFVLQCMQKFDVAAHKGIKILIYAFRVS